jgi:hypothetical protein
MIWRRYDDREAGRWTRIAGLQEPFFLEFPMMVARAFVRSADG